MRQKPLLEHVVEDINKNLERKSRTFIEFAFYLEKMEYIGAVW